MHHPAKLVACWPPLTPIPALAAPRIQLTIARQPRVTADGLLAMLRAVPSLAVVVAVRCHRLHRAALRGISRCLAAGDGAARGVRLLTDREDCDDNAPFAWAGVVL